MSERQDSQLPVLLFGTGQIADVARFYLEQGGRRIVGFLVDERLMESDCHDGLPVHPWERLEQIASPNEVELFCPVSYRKINSVRMSKYLEGKQRGYVFTSYVHPTCINNAVSIGENCFILENNVLQPFTMIGDNVILWSGNHIGHHSTIGDHCFLASQIVVSGSVRVGPRSFIGVNATIGDNLTIGEAAVIGAGALVLRDVPDEGVVAAKGAELAPVPSSRLKGF